MKDDEERSERDVRRHSDSRVERLIHGTRANYMCAGICKGGHACTADIQTEYRTRVVNIPYYNALPYSSTVMEVRS